MEKLTHIFLLLVLVNTIRKGDCVKCYLCVSKGNDDCLDPEKYKMGKKICDLQALADTKAYAEKIDQRFSTPFDFHVFQDGESVVPLQCYKQITRIHNEDIILRGCQFSLSDKMDICKKVKEVGKITELGKAAVNVTHCSVCDNDGCNGTSKNQQFTLMTLIFGFLIAKIYN